MTRESLREGMLAIGRVLVTRRVMRSDNQDGARGVAYNVHGYISGHETS